MTAIIELFPDRKGGFRYRVKGANGEKMVTSQHYRDRTDAKRGVNDLLLALAPESQRQVVTLDATPDDE